MSETKTYPTPAASAQLYATYLWRVALHEGVVTYPDALDIYEPEEKDEIADYLASLANQGDSDVVNGLRAMASLSLSMGLFELNLYDKRLADTHTENFHYVQSYMAGLVTLQGEQTAVEQQHVPSLFIDTHAKLFDNPEIFIAIWKFRENRRRTAALPLTVFTRTLSAS